jgi:hypothetical protein
MSTDRVIFADLTVMGEVVATGPRRERIAKVVRSAKPATKERREWPRTSRFRQKSPEIRTH